MHTIIAGSRLLTKDEVYAVLVDCPISCKITHVISGKAPSGGDYWGEKWAVERNIPVIPFPANWDNLDVLNAIVKVNAHGKPYNAMTGFDRNQVMADFAAVNNGCLLAIYKGKSSGTRDMVKRAKALKIPCYVYEVGI
jgi:hypothetical protein